tara:strand:+ start:408 stop:590 length:183 start_codon:yes stop_codon:yes gene_type:complete
MIRHGLVCNDFYFIYSVNFQTITELMTSKEPEARISAGMQKRTRNLAAEELLIEVISDNG